MTVQSNQPNNRNTRTRLTLHKNEVHVWLTKPQNVSGDEGLLSRYCALLSPEETVKQQRYKFAHDRHDALITRAFIRDLLSYYADIDPQDWQFEKGAKGKPELINAPIPLRFNISHTKDLIICAVTLDDDIGCDVENTARNNDVLAITRRYFSTAESTELFSLAETQQHSRFFDYWTLKESYIKAWGLGLAIPLADFSFTINDQTTVECSGQGKVKVNDKFKQSTDFFVIKNDIKISFADHREDDPAIWRSWLLYPTLNIDEKQQHRIAISLRATTNNQHSNYRFRFFDSTPLMGYQESSYQSV